MKIVYEYSYLGGSEILTVLHPDIDRDIQDVIRQINFQGILENGEKTGQGKLVYDPKEMNSQFVEAFRAIGFNAIKDTYPVSLPVTNKKIEGAFRQANFVKKRVFVEVQFGPAAYMFFDIANFHYFFNKGKSDVGIEIVPCQALQSKMSSDVSYGEQLVYDLEHQKGNFLSVPMKVILIDID